MPKWGPERENAGLATPGHLAHQLDLLIGRLEQEITRLDDATQRACSTEADPMTQLRCRLDGISGMIGRTRDEIAGLALSLQTHAAGVSDTLGAVAGDDERAVLKILDGMERVRDVADRLRTNPSVASDDVNIIDQETVAVMLACSFQDLAGQRLRKVAHAMTYVEDRTRVLYALWRNQAASPPVFQPDRRPDADLMHGPSRDGLDQSQLDALLEDAGSASQHDIDHLFD